MITLIHCSVSLLDITNLLIMRELLIIRAANYSVKAVLHSWEKMKIGHLAKDYIVVRPLIGNAKYAY